MKINIENIKVEEFHEDKIDIYLDFINDIKSNMNNPEWLGDFTKEDLVKLLSNNSHGYFFKYNDIIIASSIIIPAREKDIIKFGLDIDYKETIDYGPEAVDKVAQGNGIQLFILKTMDEKAKELGYKYAVSTVHPDNIYSINNMLQHGFIYINCNEFSRGIRNIYQKSI